MLSGRTMEGHMKAAKFQEGERVYCQTQHKLREDGSIDGCYTCGGYGYLWEAHRPCCVCERIALYRPDPTTIYVGKKLWSRDGLGTTVLSLDPPFRAVCDYCLPEYERKHGKVA